ncbi:unnamed protein product [Malus baccata var. baccata]
MEKSETFRPVQNLTTQESNEWGNLFQRAVSFYDWKLSESLILLAGPQALNDALCITLDSVWFLSTQEESNAIMGLIEKIVANGAHDFGSAVVRTSFMASCVQAFHGRTTSTIACAVTEMAQGLRDFVLECDGHVLFEGEPIAKEIHEFIEWMGPGFNFSGHQGNRDRANYNLQADEIQIQLSALKTFLDLAGNQLTSKDFSMAFYAACLPLYLSSTSFDLGCASGNWETTAIPGLFGMLVKGGVESGLFNYSLVLASSFGNTEIVRIILKAAQTNNLNVDVDRAFNFACLYSRFGTMECLVEEGNNVDFRTPLLGAAKSGCKPVVEWFVKMGCRDTELCIALVAATSSNQADVAAYLLHQLPDDLLAQRSFNILKAVGRVGGVNSLKGVAFLLGSDFLGDPATTYTVADTFAGSGDDDDANPELRAFLQEHWSERAFSDGIRQGQEHYMNIVRVLKWGESPICLAILPPELRVAIAYLPLYRECVNAAGSRLVSQRLRGQLVEAVRRLGGGVLDGVNQCRELLAVLERRLPQFTS